MTGEGIEQHVRWCRYLFDSLAEGGVWGVPRSGLVFTRREGELVLTEQMPWTVEMPITEAELAEQQADEFDSVRAHFGAAGIAVVRPEMTPAESRAVFDDLNEALSTCPTCRGTGGGTWNDCPTCGGNGVV